MFLDMSFTIDKLQLYDAFSTGTRENRYVPNLEALYNKVGNNISHSKMHSEKEWCSNERIHLLFIYE
jgi:hypothetical protein